MNAEELAAEFARRAARAQSLKDWAIFRAWKISAEVTRRHLCTPNPLHDAAADMLAALEKYRDDLCEGTCNYLPGINEDCQGCLARVVIARAKGTPDVK